MSIMYRKNGDYLYPVLKLNKDDMAPLNKYGRMRLRYLQEHHPGLYTRMLLSGKLYTDLKETQEAAQARMERIVGEIARKQGITESLKAKDQWAWVGAMNAVHQQAEEIVLKELIFD